MKKIDELSGFDQQRTTSEMREKSETGERSNFGTHESRFSR